MTEVEPRWKQGFTPPKEPRRIPARSKRRTDRQPERATAVAVASVRAGGRCEYAAVIHEVPCGWLPSRTELEPDELRGGSYRVTEQYDPERIRIVCPVHHDWKTDHKPELLERLAEHENPRNP